MNDEIINGNISADDNTDMATDRAVTELTEAEIARHLAELEKAQHMIDKRMSQLEQEGKRLDEREEKLEAAEADVRSRLTDARQQQADAQQKQKNADGLLKAAEKKADELRSWDEELSGREAAIRNAEISLDGELSKKRTEFDMQQAKLKQNDIEELEKLRMENQKECEDLKNEALKQCEKLRADAEKELLSWRREQHESLSDAFDAEKNERLAEIEEIKKEVNGERDKLEAEKLQLEREQRDVKFTKAQNEVREKLLEQRQQKLNKEVEEKAAENCEIVRNKNAMLENRIKTMSDEIMELNKQLEAFKSLERNLGCDPAEIMKTMQDNKRVISELTNKLANAPSQDLEQRYNNLQEKFNGMMDKQKETEDECTRLLVAVKDTSRLEKEIEFRQQEIDALQKKFDHKEAENASLHKELERLSSPVVAAAGRNERLRELFDLSKREGDFIIDNARQPESEVAWLEGIHSNCEKIQMEFPKRILYAFHTALKISDWSIITVLAGVSGTGKSELPRLYSYFGGINFFSAPVQPNWDSQEAMLGYFNSIDNRFDAQPLLQFLVQSTESLGDKSMAELREELIAAGYKDKSEYMSLVLLDEMNLAHVELYFAEFLSKLEFRRGKAAIYAPAIEVKLGAGMKPYELKLSRNVLWTGTMNQDETTKSLSDKVLDRGIVINFPRPRVFLERNKHTNIDKVMKESHIVALTHNTWKNWVVSETDFKGEQNDELMRYKHIVEQINEYLSVVGRAIGHRVWQSIEFYIANYPDVIVALNNEEANNGRLTDELRSAMHIAFEDQIVQKIMPKLRGIETRGRSRTDCLDQIRALLESNKFNLSADFDRACSLGYGQFIWCSAEYLEGSDKG